MSYSSSQYSLFKFNGSVQSSITLLILLLTSSAILQNWLLSIFQSFFKQTKYSYVKFQSLFWANQCAQYDISQKNQGSQYRNLLVIEATLKFIKLICQTSYKQACLFALLQIAQFVIFYLYHVHFSQILMMRSVIYTDLLLQKLMLEQWEDSHYYVSSRAYFSHCSYEKTYSIPSQYETVIIEKDYIELLQHQQHLFYARNIAQKMSLEILIQNGKNYLFIGAYFEQQQLMSQNILIRRQKFAKQLRRKEVDSYMSSIRQKIISSKDLHQLRQLQEQEIDVMKLKLQEQQYTSKAIELVLRNLLQYSPESLCSSYLLAVLEVALMHVLQWGKNQQEKDIHQMAKQIIRKVIKCPNNQNGKLPLQYCFKEILEILLNLNFEMIELWSAMALIRSEIFFNLSFKYFINYIQHYPGETLDILSTILQIFINFTQSMEEDKQGVSLSIDNLFSIIEKLQLCLGQYEMSDSDIRAVVVIAQNILKKVFEFNIQIISSSSIIHELLDYLDHSSERALSKNTMLSIIAFINNCICGPPASTQKIIKKNENMIQIIAKLMPSYSSSPMQLIPTTNWPHFDKQLVISALYFFSNLAACPDSTFLMLKHGLLNWFIAFSSHNDPRTREEVAIYLFNAVAICKEQQMEILLEKNLLSALNNVIRQQYSILAIKYGLKALIIIAKASQNFPNNHLIWNFNANTVLIHCKRLNLLAYLETLLISKSQEIQSLSENCLQLLTTTSMNF